jgi:hypothetical protein
MMRCPTRARRHRRLPRTPAASPAPLSLFAWANGRRLAPDHAANLPVARIVLLDACRDGEGHPRPALMIPGRRTPAVFPTIAAALAAKTHLEAVTR